MKDGSLAAQLEPITRPIAKFLWRFHVIIFSIFIIGGVAVLSILPAGGFIVLGCLLALINALTRYRALRKGAPEPGPLRLDCRHCVVGCGREALER